MQYNCDGTQRQAKTATTKPKQWLYCFFFNEGQIAAFKNILYDCRDVEALDEIWQQLETIEPPEDKSQETAA